MTNGVPALAVLGIAAIAAYLVVRVVVLPLVYRAAHRTAVRWDDILTDRKVINRLAWLAPLVVVRLGLDLVVDDPDLEEWLGFGTRLTDALLLFVGLLVMSAVSVAVDRIYSELDVARERPIKGYLQIAMIIAWVIGAILIIARLVDQPVGYFLGGIGALSAVVILVFRDTILSLVASVQLTSNDMLRVGDWIEMPSQNADGDVIEIALHTIKVQNWDKTITTVPTYKLISDSYKNWRGMAEAGGRRMKRSLMIDMSTIRFLSDEEIDRWARFAPLAEYMNRKRDELEEWNRGVEQAGNIVGDPRRLTNVGTFRAYVIAYLRRHPELASETMTMLVRQLQPGPHGLPLEVYVFTATTDWEDYERIQADVFDHLLAIVGEFGLRIHQAPSGADIASLDRPR
jgi:miniconductance mechanosensitive channel